MLDGSPQPRLVPNINQQIQLLQQQLQVNNRNLLELMIATENKLSEVARIKFRHFSLLINLIENDLTLTKMSQQKGEILYTQLLIQSLSRNIASLNEVINHISIISNQYQNMICLLQRFMPAAFHPSATVLPQSYSEHVFQVPLPRTPRRRSQTQSSMQPQPQIESQTQLQAQQPEVEAPPQTPITPTLPLEVTQKMVEPALTIEPISIQNIDKIISELQDSIEQDKESLQSEIPPSPALHYQFSISTPKPLLTIPNLKPQSTYPAFK